jgi:hypothetical protein
MTPETCADVRVLDVHRGETVAMLAFPQPGADVRVLDVHRGQAASVQPCCAQKRLMQDGADRMSHIMHIPMHSASLRQSSAECADDRPQDTPEQRNAARDIGCDTSSSTTMMWGLLRLTSRLTMHSASPLMLSPKSAAMHPAEAAALELLHLISDPEAPADGAEERRDAQS